MAARSSQQGRSTKAFSTAEDLRLLLSQWVRTARSETGTPRLAEMETLRLLQDEGAASIAALAQRRAVRHQSMRIVIGQLAAAEAVRKDVDPSDRRNQIVRITARGRALLRQDQRLRTQWIAQLLEDCTPETVDEVAQAILALRRLLAKSQKPPAKPA